MTEDDAYHIREIENLFVSQMRDTGASGYVIGLSGGIDSALAAALCCRAVGPDKVSGLFMPSMVTPPQDRSDVDTLCTCLGMSWNEIPIAPIITVYQQIPGFLETPYLLGNLMARIRMTLLYFQANRDNLLVCGISNRTEYLLSYCTKYGDNAADIQPIVHLLKDEVQELAKIVGIPEQIRMRIPTAGLYTGQTDEKELGLTYPEIDAAIRALEANRFVAATDTEQAVLLKIQNGAHKRKPSLSLMKKE